MTYIFRSNMTPIRGNVGNLIRATGVGIQVDVLAGGLDIISLDIVRVGRRKAPEDVVFVSGCAYAVGVAHASRVIGVPHDRPALPLIRMDLSAVGPGILPVDCKS